MYSYRQFDYHDMFKMSDPLANRPLRLTSKGRSDWLTLEQAWALYKGQVSTLERPLELQAYMGGQATDVLRAGLVSLICVSSRVVDLLRNHDFTGWTTYPVVVYDRKGERIDGYFGLGITGRAGARDRSRSAIVTKPPPVPGGRSHDVYKGLYFDECQWDGSDIFLVDNYMVVNRSVRDALRRSKVTNVQFIPLLEVEIRVDLDQFTS